MKRRWLAPTITVLAAIFGQQLTTAPLAQAQAPLPTTVMTLSDISALRSHTAGLGSRTRLLAAYSPIGAVRAERLVASLPRPSGYAGVNRTILPLASRLIVSTIYNRSATTRIQTFIVPRDGARPRLLADSKAASVGDRIVGNATSGMSNRTYTTSNRAVADCTRCAVAGTAAATGIGLACLIAEVTFVGGLICLGVSAAADLGVNKFCEEQSCPGRSWSAVSGLNAACQYGECQITASVHNGQGTYLTSLQSDILWIYFPGTSAKLSNGAYASEVNDYRSAPIGGGTSATPYTWSHISTEAVWAACSGYVEYSVTAAWSNGAFASTGFSPPIGKLYTITCPGFREG